MFAGGELVARTRQVDIELDPDPARMRQQADDAVAEIDRLVEIVGHEDHGRLARLRQRQHLVLQALARHRVQCAKRLVHQQRRRLLREAARDLQALLHAARHFGRIFVGMAGQADLAQQCSMRAPRSRTGTREASSASEMFPAAVRHGNSALP